MRHAALALTLLCPVAAAAECPPVPDLADRAEPLYEVLRQAPTEAEARRASAGLWEIWRTAPDADAQAYLDEGTLRLNTGDLGGARIAFDALIAYCPDYAEGWNQRAFAAFLARDYESALRDLDRALEINPRHVAALSGRGLTLLGLGRLDEGRADIRAALEMNPWLNERRFLLDAPEPETDL